MYLQEKLFEIAWFGCGQTCSGMSKFIQNCKKYKFLTNFHTHQPFIPENKLTNKKVHS